MKKTTTPKKKKMAIVTDVLSLAADAAKLGFIVGVSSEVEGNFFIVKHPVTKVQIEKFSFLINEMEAFRVSKFLIDEKEIKEKEAKVESLFQHLITSLSPEHQNILNLNN